MVDLRPWTVSPKNFFCQKFPMLWPLTIDRMGGMKTPFTLPWVLRLLYHCISSPVSCILMDSAFMKSFTFSFGSIDYTSSSIGMPASPKSPVGSLTTTRGARKWLVLCLIAKGVAAAFSSGGPVSLKPKIRTTIKRVAVPK
jgi:hypothetical protein